LQNDYLLFADKVIPVNIVVNAKLLFDFGLLLFMGVDDCIRLM
jgi:hypothetical protein